MGEPSLASVGLTGPGTGCLCPQCHAPQGDRRAVLLRPVAPSSVWTVRTAGPHGVGHGDRDGSRTARNPRSADTGQGSTVTGTQQQVPWWHEDGGFFGDLYREADHSLHTFFAGDRGNDARTEAEAAGVVRLCGLSRGDRVLDCPCGYGRHSVALARHGLHVTGVDINREFLRTARSAGRQCPSVDFQHADMRALPPIEPVDAVVNLFYSFGFFSPEEDLEVLRGFVRCLKPGGRFLMHTMVTVPALLTGRIPAEETRPLAGGGTLTIHRRLNEETMREEGQWTLTDPGGHRRTTAPYDVRIYHAEEFAALCRTAGFTDVRLYGGWDGAQPYHDDSPCLIAVATL
nr:class I SAM-dependent methyltransferase [Streptomyces typhae]